jgi:hypothetical protein
MSINSSFQLVGCTFNQSFCGVWVVNLQTVAPYSDASVSKDPTKPAPAAQQPATDREYLRKDAPPNPSGAAGGPTQSASTAVQRPPEEASRPSHTAILNGNSTTAVASRSSSGTQVAERPGVTSTAKNSDVQRRETSAQQVPEVSQPELSNTGNHVSMGVGPDPDLPRRTSGGSELDGPRAAGLTNRLESIKARRESGMSARREAGSGVSPARQPEYMVQNREIARDVQSSVQSRQAEPASRPPSRKVTDFIDEEADAPPCRSEVETIDMLLRNHDKMCTALGSRLESISRMKSLWKAGDIKGTIEMMSSCGDHGAAVDILSTVWSKSQLFTLDSCASLLPLLKELLASPHDEYVITAMQVLQILLQNFGPIITQNRGLDVARGPVDVTMEERIRKCNYCYEQLLYVQGELNHIKRNSGKIGELLRFLRFTLQNICK